MDLYINCLALANYQAKIQGVGEEEFPIIPSVASREARIEINAAKLREGLLKVMNAAQFSEIRPEISGVLFLLAMKDEAVPATASCA